MDCNKLPRQLLFKDRRNLEDFTRCSSINERILNNMLEIDFLQTPNFKDRALKYLNTAYYICIMLMYEEYPKLSLPKCYDIACCGNSDDKESQATTLSLVLLYLRKIYDNPTPKFKEIINIIDNFLRKKYICYDEPFAENICYYSIYQMLCKNITPEMVLIPNEFVLRKIDKQAIDDIQLHRFTWTQLTDYYDYEVMLDITMTVGKDEDEQKVICESMDYDARMFYGETSAPYKDGAKNKIDALRHEIYKRHHQEAEDELYQDMMDAQSGQLYSCDSKEVEKLKAKIESLQTQLKDAQEALGVYKDAKNINWHDKVRLELAIRIMEKADINLETFGNKARVARILQAITKLPISTCSNYASNRDLSINKHGDEIAKINSDLYVLNRNIQL